MSDFEEYIRQGEPGRQHRAYVWRTAIGLQAVDGLEPSEYLKDTARRHIEGDITIDEARELIKSYYQSKTSHEPDDEEKHEADSVSANIAKILSTRTLDLSANGYISLHRRIFDGVFGFAGKIRDYDISKKEWVLDGDSVSYLHWEDLYRAVDYDIEQERNFSYGGLSQDEIAAHVARFVSGLWQIHAFAEGNTRTTAVFVILYLRSIGFDVNNNMFAEHSWYFRNALVRANYKNVRKGIDYTLLYLERFFRNLLFGEHWELKNRYLHINPPPEWRIQPNLDMSISAGQVQDKCRTSAGQVQKEHDVSREQNPGYDVYAGSADVKCLVTAVGKEQLSLKTMMDRLRLKGRDNFIKLYLAPAMRYGFIAMLYPDKPRHPRQKYFLTEKGLGLFYRLSE